MGRVDLNVLSDFRYSGEMTSQELLPLEVGPAAREHWVAALELALGSLAHERRSAQIAKLLVDSTADPRLMENLWTGWRGSRLAGAVWAQQQPGGTAFLFPPQAVGLEPATTVRQLLAGLLEQLAARGVRLAQALLETDTGADAERFLAAGFRHVADLLYMISIEPSFPDAAPETDLEFAEFRDADQARLQSIIEQTYLNTLDCPQLNGVRNASDILEGYRATGAFDPRRWLFVRHAEHDIGCLLLSDHPQHAQWELVYMGLVPEARGHGWGLDTVRHAQWLARQADCGRLALAVDAANAPAIAMYAAAGFRAWDRRSVLLRFLGDPAVS